MSSSTLTRRRLLQTSLAAGLLRDWQGAGAQPGSPAPQWLLLGNAGKAIYRASWNAQTGAIGKPELAIETPLPTFLARHPRLPVLYACNETDDPTAAVSAFTLDPLRATLKLLRSQRTQGSAPCFVSLDPTGRLLFAANYGGGSLSVFPVDAKGVPGPAATVFHCAGNTFCGTGGPVKDRQSSPHLHCATLSPEGRSVLACDLGDDAILIFPFDPQAHSPLGQPTRVPTAAGAGPRHLAFHPNGRWLYCVNEVNCTVSLYRWRPEGKQAAAEAVPAATVSIRPQDSAEDPPSTGAEIYLSRDGRFLYTSTRFCDVLTVFAIEPGHGGLTQLQQLPCGGETPRFFGVDPSERWLLCANQDSDSVSVFARDSGSGKLTPHGSVPAPNPEYLLWV